VVGNGRASTASSAPGSAGTGGRRRGDPEGTPPHWHVYFGTADVDAALAAARAHGGSRPMPPHDSSVGRMGTVLDPFGAVFTLMETDGSSAPPER
jgi:predicted enzyme related to lactoylglutathione lyase